MDAIRFSAQTYKVQTLVDGGVRLTLDLIEPVTPDTIIQLFNSRQPGILLEVAAVAVDAEKSKSNQVIRDVE